MKTKKKSSGKSVGEKNPTSWKDRPASEIKKYTTLAKHLDAQKKQSRVNIRMSELDVRMLKKLSEREGVGYQTLMSAIIHKYVTEQLMERRHFEEIVSRISAQLKAMRP